MMHFWFIGFRGHPAEIAGKNKVRPLFLLKRFFCLVEILGYVFGAWLFGIFGLGGPSSQLAIEVFNVGSWVTHG